MADGASDRRGGGRCQLCGLTNVRVRRAQGVRLLACLACANDFELAFRPVVYRPVINPAQDELLALFAVAASRFGVEGLQRLLEVLMPSTSGRLDAALQSAVELTRWAARRGNARLCLRATEDGLRLLARRRALVEAVEAVQLLRDPWSSDVDAQRALLVALDGAGGAVERLAPLISTLRRYERTSCA
jgi:hypothetical protein